MQCLYGDPCKRILKAVSKWKIVREPFLEKLFPTLLLLSYLLLYKHLLEMKERKTFIIGLHNCESTTFVLSCAMHLMGISMDTLQST